MLSFAKVRKNIYLTSGDCEKSLSLPKICGDPVCGAFPEQAFAPGRVASVAANRLGFMITLDTIRKPVTAELEAFDEFVDRQFTAEGELLSEIGRAHV